MVYTILNSGGYSLSDHKLEFEGIKQAIETLLARDASPTDKNVILERYFNDMYAMFQNKLSALAVGYKMTEEDEQKLRGLLDEMIKVKALISKAEITM